MKHLLLFNTLMTFVMTCIGQELVPLNEYEVEILDTTKYEVKYYLQRIDTSEQVTIRKVFDLANNLVSVEVINKSKKRKKVIPVDSEKICFNADGDTLKRINHHYSTSKKSIAYYSDGQISSRVLYEQSRFKDGSFKNVLGEFVSMERDDQGPSLKATYDEYINFLSK